nr:polysaccharide deacetylase family protein [uncultured Anaerostipes sp.]
MKKRILASLCLLLMAACFVNQLKYGKADPLGIAGQTEGEGGLLANNALNKKKVYLTFDDGPSDNTEEILDILKENNVKATFFVIGKETEQAKKSYQRIVLEGHTLAMHSYSHNYDQIYASVDAFSKDLKKLQNYLYEITEIRPVIYRFPGGSSNSCVKDISPYISFVNSQGWLYFDWNAQSGDALDFDTSAEQLNENILKDVHSQDVSVVLMHDLHEADHTVEGLDALIKTLKKEGYQILPITANTRPVHHVSVDKRN